jgi:uncharacterized protein (TIGR03437 family)
MRFAAVAALCVFAVPVCAAEFQSGQAAIAVIGQPDFSAHEAGINPVALSLSNGRLYVADTSKRLLAYDISQIPATGLAPVATLNQSVIPGISAVGVYGKSVAIADTANHRVLLWRDGTTESAQQGPDVILSDPSLVAEPISVALDGQRLFIGDGALHRVLIWNSLPQSGAQPPDVVLGPPSDAPAANSISRPVALESDGQHLFVADSGFRRVLVFSPADVPLASNSLLNSASLAPGPLAPGALITIAASGFTQASEAAPDGAAQPLPKNLAGVEVIVDGAALPLLSVSPSEIRAQLPYDLANRSSVSLFVQAAPDNGAVLTSSAVAVSLLPSAPGLFAFSGKEPRPGMAFHSAAPVTSADPAAPGESITLWAAGLGLVASPAESPGVQAGVPNTLPDAAVQSPVAVTINGLPAQVLSAALPEDSIGVYEIRVLLPASLPGGNAILSISQEGRQSNAVTIPLRNGIQ